jgi:hypothetical protein
MSPMNEISDALWQGYRVEGSYFFGNRTTRMTSTFLNSTTLYAPSSYLRDGNCCLAKVDV